MGGARAFARDTHHLTRSTKMMGIAAPSRARRVDKSELRCSTHPTQAAQFTNSVTLPSLVRPCA